MSENNKEYFIKEKELKEINKGIFLFFCIIILTMLGMTFFSDLGYRAIENILPFFGWGLIILSSYVLVSMFRKRFKIKIEMNKMLNGD